MPKVLCASAAVRLSYLRFCVVGNLCCFTVEICSRNKSRLGSAFTIVDFCTGVFHYENTQDLAEHGIVFY